MKNFPNKFYPDVPRAMAEIKMNTVWLASRLKENIPLEKWPTHESNPMIRDGDSCRFAGDLPDIPEGFHWDRPIAEKHFAIYRAGDVLPFLNVTHVYPDSSQG